MSDRKEVKILNPTNPGKDMIEDIYGKNSSKSGAINSEFVSDYINTMKVEGINSNPTYTGVQNEPHKQIKNDRKNQPIYSGVLKYFPKALLEVSKVSLAGNRQHHEDKPLHWDRNKSNDDLDALMRHLIDAGTVDTDGVLHSAKVAWRALANLERELEKN